MAWERGYPLCYNQQAYVIPRLSSLLACDTSLGTRSPLWMLYIYLSFLHGLVIIFHLTTKMMYFPTLIQPQ